MWLPRSNAHTQSLLARSDRPTATPTEAPSRGGCPHRHEQARRRIQPTPFFRVSGCSGFGSGGFGSASFIGDCATLISTLCSHTVQPALYRTVPLARPTALHQHPQPLGHMKKSKTGSHPAVSSPHDDTLAPTAATAATTTCVNRAVGPVLARELGGSIDLAMAVLDACDKTTDPRSKLKTLLCVQQPQPHLHTTCNQHEFRAVKFKHAQLQGKEPPPS